MIKDIIPLIRKITEKQNLTFHETEQAFKILEEEDLEGYYYYTFLAALHTKGETSEELLGFCKANEYFVPSFNINIDANNVIDISGTGGDKIKTPNISTATSFVVASKGINVIKQAFLSVTGITGSADLLQNFGIDVLGMSAKRNVKEIKNIFQNNNMVIYHANSMADPEKRKGFFNFWLKKVPEIGLSFVTAYHLAANAYSPIPMKKRVYGVFDKKYLRPLAELFQKLGYNKGLIINGEDGLDEISNIGETNIAEFDSKNIKMYKINPNDLGVKKAEIDEIKGNSKEENIKDFLRIIYGKEKGAKRDLVLANSATAFYVMNAVPNLKEGVKLAGSLVDNGLVKKKFEDYVKFCSDLKKLEDLKNKYDLK